MKDIFKEYARVFDLSDVEPKEQLEDVPTTRALAAFIATCKIIFPGIDTIAKKAKTQKEFYYYNSSVSLYISSIQIEFAEDEIFKISSDCLNIYTNDEVLLSLTNRVLAREVYRSLNNDKMIEGVPSKAVMLLNRLTPYSAVGLEELPLMLKDDNITYFKSNGINIPKLINTIYKVDFVQLTAERSYAPDYIDGKNYILALPNVGRVAYVPKQLISLLNSYSLLDIIYEKNYLRIGNTPLHEVLGKEGQYFSGSSLNLVDIN